VSHSEATNGPTDRAAETGGQPLKKWAYYPGCVAEFSSKELDATTKALAPMLGIELVPMPAATCCGAGDIAEARPNLYLTLNIRIMSQAEEMGHDVLTICNVCTLNLRRANKMVKDDPLLLEAVNEELVKAGARPYEGTKEVTHLLWYISTEEGLALLEERGPRGLKGLRVAPYYGCQLLRPSSVMGFEDPDKPQSMERLIRALGGVVADYEAKSKCCGFPIILAREDVALGELVQPLEQATAAGADVMVTPCPLCHLSLDAWQKKASQQAGETFQIPILHLAQLLGAAAGLAEDELRFKRHVVRLGDDVKAKLRLPSAVGTAGD
jgi:succinate dehydrogenase / fumarate reductase cytochrome b subunit